MSEQVDTVGGNRVSLKDPAPQVLVPTQALASPSLAVATSPAPDVEAAFSAAQRRSAPTAEGIRGLVASAGHNPALVEFPADPWGFTRELRKVGLLAASAVRGQADKHITLLGTLMVLTAHVKARVEEDQRAHRAYQDRVKENFAEAEKYNRNYGMKLEHKGGVTSGHEPTDGNGAQIPLDTTSRDVDSGGTPGTAPAGAPNPALNANA